MAGGSSSMFGIFLSGLNSMLGFVMKSATLKWGILFVIFFVVQALASFVIGYLPSMSAFSGLFASVDPGVQYFLTPWRIDFGFSGCVSAMAIRFLIRRIPIIG